MQRGMTKTAYWSKPEYRLTGFDIKCGTEVLNRYGMEFEAIREAKRLTKPQARDFRFVISDMMKIRGMNGHRIAKIFNRDHTTIYYYLKEISNGN